MFDVAARKLIDPPLNLAGRILAGWGVSADAVTAAGFVVGLIAVPLIATGHYRMALIAIILNRLADGLDGAVARRRGQTDFGGYLDIVCDFIFYSAIPLAFALADPQRNGPAAAFLMLSFVATGSTFLAYAIIAAKRGVASAERGAKSFFYLGGLTEGTETIALFVVFCLWPDWFVPLAVIFGALAWTTAIGRMFSTWRAYGGEPRPEPLPGKNDSGA